MFKSILSACLITALLIPSVASAGYRCTNNETAKKGDTKSDVKLKCGPPVDASYEGVIKIRGNHVYVDRWTYNPGKGKFYKILNFHDGSLANIENGPRVR